MLTLQEYADWAANEVLKKSPASLTADWWVSRTEAIASIGRNGIFETLSLCCALCEFLGTLYRGTSGNSDYRDFKAFVDDFFPPRYRTIHDLSGQARCRSDFYTVFRSKILHGGTPAAIAMPGDTMVIGWIIGWDIRNVHLQVINGNFHVDGEQFREDLATAAAQYVERLQSDSVMQGRWRRGFWWRFRPVDFPKTDWEQEGKLRSIPA